MKERPKQKSATNSVRKKILVVEDETSILRVCQRVLGNEGFEVDIACNGRVAQDMILENYYDYFLFDIKMPILDGKTLYYWLKDEYPELAERVIFMTGESIGMEIQSFLRETGVAFLIKPFTPSELKAKFSEFFKD